MRHGEFDYEDGGYDYQDVRDVDGLGALRSVDVGNDRIRLLLLCPQLDLHLLQPEQVDPIDVAELLYGQVYAI